MVGEEMGYLEVVLGPLEVGQDDIVRSSGVEEVLEDAGRVNFVG